MHTYIVCFCGRSLADIKELFIKLCEKNNTKIRGDPKHKVEILPADIAAADFIEAEGVDKILDKLGVKHECCRARLMTQIYMDEYLEPVVEPKNYADA